MHRKVIEKRPTKQTVVPSHTHFATNDITNRYRGGSTTGKKRQWETNDGERDVSASKRPRLATITSPVIAFVLGVVVGTFNSNVRSRVCQGHLFAFGLPLC